MPTAGPLPQIDLARIRQHETSQQRAWEELGYILVPDIDGLPLGTRLQRRATPDAGVEFSCAAPPPGDGTWAWQAKYLFRLDADAFKQMTRSAEDALDANPTLTRYAFILPVDRTSIARGKAKGGMQRWHESVAAWEAAAAARGMTVEFVYIGHSDVVTALSQDQHAGAVRYFFDERLFTNEFFRHQVEREIVNLGGRYDPSVHVELDVADAIDALCRSPRWAERLAGLVRDVAKRDMILRHLAASSHVAEQPDLAAAVTDAADSAARAGKVLDASRRRLTTADGAVLSELRAAVDACAVAARRAEETLHDAAARIVVAVRPATPLRTGRRRSAAERPAPDRDPAQARRDAMYDAAAEASAARRSAETAAHALSGRQARAADAGALLIEGPAGCGKSHLVADAAAARAREGLPTLLVLGQHLQLRPVWQQIAQTVDLPMTGQELRAALEVAARVRGAGRALIIIDAVNEGPGPALWRDQLNGFLADIARHPWLAVVLTIRDTYAPTVLPDDLPTGSAVRLIHPGLTGHEGEALVRYAEHYGLRLPDLPPLLPELRNPLFLRSMCLSVRARGLDSVPREAASLTWVFDGLLEAVNRAISDPARLDVDPSDDLVRRAADALARAMLDADVEALPLHAAREICLGLHPETKHSKSLLTALIADGILLRETSTTGDGAAPQEIVRFTYQRLADHLRADAILAAHADDAALRDAVLALASGPGAWARAGLLEALVLLTPERRGRELADVTGVRPRRRAARRPYRALTKTQVHNAYLQDVLRRAFFDTLPWRAPASFTDRTHELLQRYLDTGAIGEHDWLALLISLACVPDHPLNAHRLDAALHRLNLPERDLHWSEPLLSIWGDDFDPITRSIDWAWSPTSTPADDVAELAATLLAWFCTSPNRRLRDTATKALVRLLDGRTAVAAQLVERFAGVDDPYVTERVLAAACGHALRHRSVQLERLDDIAALGRAVYDAVFAVDRPTAHALIRHYARTAVETIDTALRAHGRQLDRDLSAAVPPYTSNWPLTAPPLRTLAHQYGRPGQRYLTTATVLGFDFQQYTIERGLAAEFALPNQARRQAARRAAARREAEAARTVLLDALPPTGRQAVADFLGRADAPGDDGLPRWAVVRVLEDRIPASARPALDRLERARHRADDRGPVRPDPDLLGRWIAARVLDLGWTSERFDDRDRMLSRARSAGWSQTERFGKKYAWIAYHELVGQLGDHCQLHESWQDARPESYDTPFQVGGAVDLDPSVVLRGDEPPQDTAAGRLRALRNRDERRDAWWLAAHVHSPSADRDGAGWLHDPSDIPAPHELLAATDPAGGVWLAAESHTTWTGAGRADDNKRQLWIRAQANIVRTADLDAFRTWAPEQNWMGLWMPTPSEHPTGYLGGYPDQQPWQARMAEVDAERRSFAEAHPYDPPGWQRTTQHGAPDAPFALATTGYDSSGSRDSSAIDLPRAVLPAPALLDLLDARWSGGDPADARQLGLGPVETEYSWTSQGRIVAFSTAGRSFGSTTMLFIRADALADALGRADLAMWTWLLGEKIHWLGAEPQPQRADIYAAADLTFDRPRVWGLTVDHVDWDGQDQSRSRLVRQRLP
ncbi:hypothetical protein [Geodermatophilus poikilotrophus]|uniref:ATP-binding protein n=1 Tax=Geodermatophilus poikilotrophus TaxID=1333667 RepID=A0A1I0I656_9ACTN|nr:hypothetical protein [Geodermatophilus poikilotrophus]SET92128.1 hypothetical protein SAMN04488546_4242 [Geodermatophilus poikilotrophus]